MPREKAASAPAAMELLTSVSPPGPSLLSPLIVDPAEARAVPSMTFLNYFCLAARSSSLSIESGRLLKKCPKHFGQSPPPLSPPSFGNAPKGVFFLEGLFLIAVMLSDNDCTT